MMGELGVKPLDLLTFFFLQGKYLWEPDVRGRIRQTYNCLGLFFDSKEDEKLPAFQEHSSAIYFQFCFHVRAAHHNRQRALRLWLTEGDNLDEYIESSGFYVEYVPNVAYTKSI